MQLAAMAHTFPMVRAGGLFILVMGVGVLLGGIFSRFRLPMLGLGGGAATIALIVFAFKLTRPLGVPTRVQLWALAGAVALEIVLIGLIAARFKHAGERTFLLAILCAVGIHFAPMAMAFGPLCAALAVCVVANAFVGLRIKRDLALSWFWIIDGALKIIFGGLMLSVRTS